MRRLKRNKFNCFLLLTVFLLLPTIIFSQKLFFKKTNIIDEESGIVINDLINDDSGLLWLATDQGLIQSDGENLLRFEIADSSTSQNIRSLFYKDDLLYLGWENGSVSIYSIFKNKTIRKIEISPSPINSICLDAHNKIWMATEENGIYILDGDKVSLLDINFGLADNTVSELIFDQKANIIWAATDRGISKISFKYEDIKIKNYGSNDGLLDNLITSIELDMNASLWMGTYSGKLFVLDSLEQIQNIDLEQWNCDKINDLLIKGNSLWIASENKGLGSVNVNKLKLEYYDQNKILTGIKDLLFVNENHLLINNASNEILITDKNIKLFYEENGIAMNNISLVYADKNKGLYYANDKALYLLNSNNELELLVDLKKEKIDYVISLLVDSKGMIWFGSFDQGLFRLSDGKIDHYTEEDGLINNNIMTLHEWKGAIWCGTLGGLCSITDTDQSPRFTNYSKEQGLEAAYIYQLYSSNKSLYIASDGEGLIQFDENDFKLLPSDLFESVYDISGLGDDHLFISIEGGQIIEVENGLYKNVYSIRNKDRAVDISGISLMGPSKLTFIWDKGIGVLNLDDGQYQLFGSSSGLSDFNNDFLNVLSIDDERNTWVGSQNYLVKMDHEIANIEYAPKSIIRSVELFSTPLDTQIHSFDFDENHFTFHLSSLWYQDPKTIQYQYRLLGLNEEWQTTKDKNIVFPKLESGNYRFEFRSGFNEAINNAEINHYDFRIAKAFYLTWWFFSLCALLFVVGIFGLIKQRDKKLLISKKLEYERVLSQFELLKSQINPHFLFNSLNTAYALIAKDQDDARNYLLSLSNYLRAILTKNQDHVIDLKKELKFAKNYTLLQKKRFGDNLIFEIEINDDRILDSYIPPLTLQILLENAIKHNIISRTNPLITRIFIEDDYIVVQNNLQEKKGNGEGTKIGLSNIKSRYHILFDKEIIISKDDASFTVKLPIIHKYVENFAD